MYSVTIIGMGRVGRALASSLPASNYRIDSLIIRDLNTLESQDVRSQTRITATELRDLAAIRSDIILITTQDREIEGVVGTIEPLIEGPRCVFHTSGALSSDILQPLRRRGARVGSIHPLVSISGGAGTSQPFNGVFFGIEGDAEAVIIARTVAADLGGKPFAIETSKKAVYHAAAVMACGHLVALLDASFEMMAQCGPDAALAKELLMPLVRSTITNLADQTPESALTGPFARLDVETIDRHLRELEQDPDRALLNIYLVLGERSLDLALRHGADHAGVEQLRERLSMAKARIR